MFGFQEACYTVTAQIDVEYQGRPAILQRRKQVADASLVERASNPMYRPLDREQAREHIAEVEARREYLALLPADASPVWMFYRDPKDGDLGMDWARLTANPVVKCDELGWSELVHGDTGYGKDGSICMY